jgi:hypothetical protein
MFAWLEKESLIARGQRTKAPGVTQFAKNALSRRKKMRETGICRHKNGSKAGTSENSGQHKDLIMSASDCCRVVSHCTHISLCE